jgi:hypothetical protein
MRPVRRLLLLTVLLAGAAPAVSLPEPTPEELEANRRLVERYRADPEHYARLKRDLKAFAALPPERQNRLRQLDQDLHEENAANLTRLWRVLDRYATWLEHLSPADRQQVENAADARARLAVIRQLRENEWIKRLPEVKHKEVTSTPPENRAALIAELREAERHRRQEWQRAISSRDDPPWRRGPWRSQTDLPPEVRTYLTGTLIPLLNPEEKKTLDDAEGLSPQFGQALLKLAESHPVGLPGQATGPMSFQDLLKPFKQQVRRLPRLDRGSVDAAEGKWPDYAIAVSEMLRKNGMLPQEMGPCHPRHKDFPPATQAFIEKTLLPKLDDQEKQRLHDAEGRWPDYPRLLLELARRHNLQVPGMPLPGPREFWDRLRQEVRAGGVGS